MENLLIDVNIREIRSNLEEIWQDGFDCGEEKVKRDLHQTVNPNVNELLEEAQMLLSTFIAYGNLLPVKGVIYDGKPHY